MKPENILVDNEYEFIKICDFGCSQKLSGHENDGILTTVAGSENYMPPEMLSKKPYNGQFSDIFCIGKVLFTMVTGGYLPFPNALQDEKEYKFFAKQRADLYFRKFWPNFSDELKSLFV